MKSCVAIAAAALTISSLGCANETIGDGVEVESLSPEDGVRVTYRNGLESITFETAPLAQHGDHEDASARIVNDRGRAILTRIVHGMPEGWEVAPPTQDETLADLALALEAVDAIRAENILDDVALASADLETMSSQLGAQVIYNQLALEEESTVMALSTGYPRMANYISIGKKNIGGLFGFTNWEHTSFRTDTYVQWSAGAPWYWYAGVYSDNHGGAHVHDGTMNLYCSQTSGTTYPWSPLAAGTSISVRTGDNLRGGFWGVSTDLRSYSLRDCQTVYTVHVCHDDTYLLMGQAYDFHTDTGWDAECWSPNWAPPGCYGNANRYYVGSGGSGGGGGGGGGECDDVDGDGIPEQC